MISYKTGCNPEERGVYACRIENPDVPQLLKDVFLMWFDNQWGYTGSDQKYRGEVLGWIGPLQRKL